MLAGDRVRFHATDVFLTNFGVAVAGQPQEEWLEGTIVGFSDSGPRSRFFAVIEVVRTETMVVPLEKLELIESHANGEA